MENIENIYDIKLRRGSKADFESINPIITTGQNIFAYESEINKGICFHEIGSI